MKTKKKKNRGTKYKLKGGDSLAQWLTDLLPDPAALSLIHSFPEVFQRKKMPNLLRLINRAA